MVNEAKYTFDIWEALIRLLKYAIEAIMVALAAYLLPQNKLKFSEIWMIALTAAAIFAIFDLLSPSISAGARQGVGLGAGFRLVGFPPV
jgi:ABC-type Co2+ transport system permease subunit